MRMNNTIKLGNFISEYSIRNRADDDIPVYSVTNKEGFCRDYFSKDVASQDRSTYKIVPRGCFAYNPSRINVGSVDWQRKEDRVIVSPLYVVFSVSKGLDQQYLYYYLKSEKCLYYIKELASGSVRDNLKLSMLKEFTIPNITLEEQRKAVMVLEQTDRLIVLQERQMTVLDELVKSRFIEMFGDIAPSDYRSMEDICSIITDGTHQPPKFVREGIPFLFVSNITGNVVTYDAEKFIDEQTYSDLIKRTPIEIGDILLSTVGSYGHPAVVKEPTRFCFQRHIAYLKPIASVVDSDYLHGAILSSIVQAQIEDKVKGIAQKTLNLSEIRKIRIPVPEIHMQREFAHFAAQTDKSKLAVKQSLEKLETLKKSLMQQYFGG